MAIDPRLEGERQRNLGLLKNQRGGEQGRPRTGETTGLRTGAVGGGAGGAQRDAQGAGREQAQRQTDLSLSKSLANRQQEGGKSQTQQMAQQAAKIAAEEGTKLIPYVGRVPGLSKLAGKAAEKAAGTKIAKYGCIVVMIFGIIWALLIMAVPIMLIIVTCKITGIC